MKNEHPAFFLRTGMIINSLNYEGIALVAVLPLSDSDRLRVGSVNRLNSLND